MATGLSTSKTAITYSSAARHILTNPRFLLLLSALAVLGGVVLLLATHWGIGTSPDSIVYITGARSLLIGQGFSLPRGATFEPITHHAPLYSALLAAIGLVGLDPLEGARGLNVFLFGANILLIGLMIARVTRSARWLPVLGSFLGLTSLTMLTVHVMAWTEPTFIFFSLLVFWLLTTYLENSKRSILVGAAFLLSLALLTRYAGMALVVTGVLGLVLFSQKPFVKRLVDGLAFGLLSSLPLGLWLLRNKMVAGTAANRDLLFHPVGRTHLWQATDTISSWLLIPSTAPGWIKLSLWSGMVLLLVALLGWVYRQQKLQHGQSLLTFATHLPVLVRLLLLFLIIYSAFLVVSISFLDANTPLDDRILSPVYVAGSILSMVLLHHLWGLIGQIRLLQVGVVIALLIFSAVYLFRGLETVRVSYLQGLGFSSLAWQQSELLAHVRRLPAGKPIFTNSPEAIYLYTDKPARPMPKKFFAADQQVNPNYQAALTDIKKELQNGGVIVYFNTLVGITSLATKDELEAELQVCVLAHASDGTIYGLAQCPQ